MKLNISSQTLRRFLPVFGVVAGLCAGLGLAHFTRPSETLEVVDEESPHQISLNAESNPSITNAAPRPLQETAHETEPAGNADSEYPETSPTTEPSDLEIVSPTGRMLTGADEWLRMGYYSRALDRFRTVVKHSDASTLDSIRLRIALCHEFLGEWSKALELYRELAIDSQMLVIRDLSRLGEARCLVARQETELLRTRIFPVAILDESAFSQRVNGEMLHLVGRAMMLDANHTGRQWSSVGADDISQLVIPQLHPDPARELQQLENRVVTTQTAHIPVFRVLQLSEGAPDGCFVQMNQPMVSVTALLTAMVQQCGFQSTISDAAETAISGHGQTVVVADKSLSLILDGLSLRFGLTWQVEGDALTFRTEHETPQRERESFKSAATERLLRWAVLEAADSYQSHSSQLMLGVIQYDRGEITDASHIFQLYVERHPHTTLTGVAAFNLAKCFLKNRQYDDAEEALLRSIDHSHTTIDTRIAAYMYLGRLQVESGRIPKALSSLIRGLSQSRGHASEPDIAILLASTYLLADNPLAANSILMERRSMFESDSQKVSTAFISAYSRLRRASEPARVARETRAVVAALSHFRPKQVFGKHWYLLCASAYEDAGLRSNAIGTYVLAMKNELPDFLLTHCGIQLAELWEADGLTEKAKALLSSLPETSNRKVRCRGLVSRARLACRMGEFESAVRFASTAARESEDVTTTQEALRVLGESYEKSGNHLAAVYCYAGMVPDTEASGVEQVKHTFSGSEGEDFRR